MCDPGGETRLSEKKERSVAWQRGSSESLLMVLSLRWLLVSTSECILQLWCAFAIKCCIYSFIYLYKVYISECLSSCTLQKRLLFTGEGRLPAYRDILPTAFLCHSNLKKAPLLFAGVQKTTFFFPDTWRDPFVWLHLFLHQHWFTRAHLQRSSRKMSGRHTQNTTRFNLCGTTSHTCPHKCKGSFLLHTRHAQDEFQGIFLHCEVPRDFPLHGTAAVVVVVIVVGKPVPAVSYFCFFLLGFWLRMCPSTAPLLISITWQCAYVVKYRWSPWEIFFFEVLLDF